ncbi:uncharacterized protein DNG_01771 [Cephalotrichum gorgonifer]|uniref:Uncharacterized protein n=1 Tax=Cephalotrichum gorgonifer TaxID=2041049 RepID=A0AAE8MSB7_9PEZI|nr:uncharacterized protein DNG_01771 [Cephalotrichum gorgonifer]
MGKCYTRKPLVDLQHDKWDPEYYICNNGKMRGTDHQFRTKLASVAGRLYNSHRYRSKIMACGPALRSEFEPRIQFKTAGQAANDREEQEEKAAREKKWAADT